MMVPRPGDSFFSVVPSIGEKFFPDGSPLYSTNDLYNYKATREIIAARLSQDGPAPSFLSPYVYDTLVTGDIKKSVFQPSFYFLYQGQCLILVGNHHSTLLYSF